MDFLYKEVTYGLSGVEIAEFSSNEAHQREVARKSLEVLKTPCLFVIQGKKSVLANWKRLRTKPDGKLILVTLLPGTSWRRQRPRLCRIGGRLMAANR